MDEPVAPSVIEAPDTLFRAQVVRVLEEQQVPREDGAGTILAQKLELDMQEGPFKGQIVIFDGTVVPTIGASKYRVGDRVVVWWSKDVDGTDQFYVTDYVRDTNLLWMAVLFACVVLLVSRTKGLRALISLAVSFVLILTVLLPRLLQGDDPVWLAVVFAMVIVTSGILFSSGFTRQSLVGVVSVCFTLFVTGGLAYAFAAWARLTGYASEESLFLAQMLGTNINMAGLYLAGVIIGTLGVLDDVVVSQVSVVQELIKANPDLSRLELFRRSMRVGTDHAAAVTNTLFLAYAGASLPLLLLFSIKQPPFLTPWDALNNELVASEVVRTLVGSIGLVLTVPITTALAVRLLKK